VVSRLDTEAPAWLTGADLPAMAARGEALYLQHQCRSCHELGQSPKLLSGLPERLGYNAVIEVLEAPQSPMPVFPLSDTQRRELAVFLLAPQPGNAGADK
jgi:mono/diheme cytochrome c family protein